MNLIVLVQWWRAVEISPLKFLHISFINVVNFLENRQSHIQNNIYSS